MSRDDIFSLPRDRVGQFRFDDQVAEVFPDMISRSVPGYASILSVIEQLAERFVQPHTNVYDLGCSLGAASRLIQNQAPASATIHAVDNSSAMIDRFGRQLDRQSGEGAKGVESAVDSGSDEAKRCPIRLHLADVCEVDLSDASMIVLNFTLQFVASARRRELLQRCCDALRPGGVLLLSEKVCFDDPADQALLGELHLDFKRACGYSELEIAQKRTSLENTLVPESIEAHVERLRGVGFEVVTPWFQCFNFASILAVKSPGGQA